MKILFHYINNKTIVPYTSRNPSQLTIATVTTAKISPDGDYVHLFLDNSNKQSFEDLYSRQVYQGKPYCVSLCIPSNEQARGEEYNDKTKYNKAKFYLSQLLEQTYLDLTFKHYIIRFENTSPVEVYGADSYDSEKFVLNTLSKYKNSYTT
jgi:hypothetical protein